MLHSLLPLSASLPADHVREEIPRGQAGTAATIARMIRVAQHGKRDDRIRQLCGRVIENCGQKDYYCYAKSIHDFVTHKIKYAYDPVDVELVESAWNVVKNGIADCDSKCGLFAAMCEQVGLPVQFVTVKGNPSSNEFTHVYCRVQIPKRGWVASDTTMPNKPFGWEPKGLPEKTWDVSSEDAFNMDAFTCESLGDMDGGVVAMQTSVDASSLYGMGDGFGGGFGFSLGALGANSSEITLNSVINGSAYNELRAAKDQSNQLMTDAGAILNKANNIVDPSQRSAAMSAYTRAQGSATRARSALFSAISKYNELAQAIQTYSNGAYKPQQLGNPIVIGGLLLVGGIKILVDAYSQFMATWRDEKGQSQRDNAEALRIVAASKGVKKSDYEKTAGAAGEVIDKFGVYILAGGGFIVLLTLLKKKW